MADTGKILNAEIDVRSYFNTFDFPKLPEIIQAIEKVFSADITKVVKALRGPLMGLYRIQAKDYTLYKDKEIELRGQNIPVILRTQQEKKKKDGVLVTIYDAFSPNFQPISGKDFDQHFLEFNGLTMIRQTTPQFYKGTRVLNGNRYFVADFAPEQTDIGEVVTVDGATFKIQYEGMQRYCFLCNDKHGKQCKSRDEFDRMKEFRKDKITHKIYSDSSLRNVNQLALAANVACTSGGGIGQIVNAVNADPENAEKVIIFAGANEIQNATDNFEFTHCITKAAEKLHQLTKTKQVTLILPTVPIQSTEEKARYELLKETMSDIRSITLAQIDAPVEYSNNHPTREGTKTIIGLLEEEIECQLILETNHVTTDRIYSQVQACYKMGCRTCDTKQYTQSLCDKCRDESKLIDITKIEALIKEINERDFPPPNEEDANMAELLKRSLAGTETEIEENENKGAKRQNVGEHHDEDL